MNKYLLQRHTTMLAFQEKIRPFTPTIRELCDVWFVGSTTAHATLQHLYRSGLCVARSHGRKTYYYAVRANR